MRCSVLINNFNNEQFLRACIDSALEQTLQPAEVIVYDDGSTDSSPDLLRGYGSRIRTILAPKFSPNKHQNQIRAVNEAFRVSTGEFVFLLDGDDMFLPSKLEAYSAALRDPEVVMVQAPLVRINRLGERIGEFHHPWQHGHDLRQRIHETQDLDFFYPTSALGFRRDFLEKAMPIETRKYQVIGPDTALHLLAVLQGRVVTLDEPHTLYRHHTSNLSGRFKRPFHRCVFDRRVNQFYNDHARELGQPQLALWRNRRFVRRTARHVIDLLSGKLSNKGAAHA